MGPNTLRFSLSDRIGDAEVGPSHVPLTLLGKFADEVAEFLKGSNKEVDPKQLIASVESGSLAVVVDDPGAPGLWRDIERLREPSSLGSMDSGRAKVIEKWQAAARQHIRRSYTLSTPKLNIPIRIDNESDFRNSQAENWVPVEKYLDGVVVDWGGATSPNVHLKLQNGVVQIVSASQKQLFEPSGNAFGRPATLRVSAEQNLATRELRKLALIEIMETPNWVEAEFEHQVAMGTRAWADVPDDWLESLRGDRA